MRIITWTLKVYIKVEIILEKKGQIIMRESRKSGEIIGKHISYDF